MSSEPTSAAEKTPGPTPAGPSGTATESGGGSRMRAIAGMASGYDAQAALLTPVQRKGDGAAESGRVQAAASVGISGGGGGLPFASQIQRSFGGYDISNVQAHVDAAAANASAAMGADAYATGNHIAFGKSPDLHTAAHEAAHVVQQQAGVQLSGGVGQAGDRYEQHADRVADAVVQGKSAEGLLGEMAPSSQAGGAEGVQRKSSTSAGLGQAVQRQETPETSQTAQPVPTPHANAALEHVNANGVDTGAATTEAPVHTVPLNYPDYVAHIKATFAGELAEIAKLKQQQKGNGKEAEEAEAKLKLDAEELNWYRHELEVKKRKIEELEAVQQVRSKTLDAIAPYEDKTMAELHAAMEALLKEFEGRLGKLSEEEVQRVEAIMYASIELGGQLNPDASGKVRLLYLDKIDNYENARLVQVAESEGMELAKLAELGVKYRTWSKTFVRTELMDDKIAAEILFLRDLGIDGLQVGVTPESLAEKLFRRSQKNIPREEQVSFSKANNEQQIQIYKGMLAKAKQTNPNVNAALTAPRMRRPLDLADDQPSPTPEERNDTGTGG